MPGKKKFTFGFLDPCSDSVEPDFVIQPYEGPAHHYVYTEDETADDYFAELGFKAFDSVDGTINMKEAEYIEMVDKAVKYCKANKSKVVCSRVADEPMMPKNYQGWLVSYRKKFPNALVYLLYDKELGTWIGATPEILVKQTGTLFETVSLAGTRWGKDPFTKKEFEEQEVVTKSILDDLLLDKKAASDREEVTYGSVRHLKTKITWSSGSNIITQAALLHPTPAVCGYPKDVAKEFIEYHEPHDRKLYSGYLLFNGVGGNKVAYVNIRCAEFFLDQLRFYVGGGVNAMSDPKDEWDETEQKFQTQKKVIFQLGSDL